MLEVSSCAHDKVLYKRSMHLGCRTSRNGYDLFGSSIFLFLDRLLSQGSAMTMVIDHPFI